MAEGNLDTMEVEEFLNVYLENNLQAPGTALSMHDYIVETYKDYPALLDAFEDELSFKRLILPSETYNPFPDPGMPDRSAEMDMWVSDRINELNKLLRETGAMGIVNFEGSMDAWNYPDIVTRLKSVAYNSFGVYKFDEPALEALQQAFHDIHADAGPGNLNTRNTYDSLRGGIETARQEAKIAELLAANADNKQHLVRGALIRCIYGSHYRMLNLPWDHGVYIKGKPQIYDMDAQPGKKDEIFYHIGWFGHCTAPNHPETEKIRLKLYTHKDQEGYNLTPQGDSTKEDWICVPDFPTKWQNTEECAYVENELHQAVAIKSYIMCSHGGLIYPLTSGQLEINIYTPTFAACPFAENLAAGSNFMQWCEKKDICPYRPGTYEYDGWYKAKIDSCPVADLNKTLDSYKAS
ncbi:MAG: DUF4280 domain-containing protein, partial [Oscillospiraceae bacterium]|nr:DUF4280 domain-containing protein [Oscillospiraceae bacterium]